MKKAATKKKKAKEFQTPYTVTGALVKGNAITKLSMLKVLCFWQSRLRIFIT